MAITPITTAVQVITIDSNRILHHTQADLIDRRIPNVIRLVQYDDTLPVIAVDLKAGGVNYTLPSGAACNIRIKKPDGTVIYNPALGCDSTRSVVYFEATEQMGSVDGDLHSILEVIVSGKVAGSSPLRVVVEKNPIQEDDIESSSEMKTLIEYVNEAEAWAKGTVGGEPVPSDADQYHNNSKYYSELSADSAEAAESYSDTAEQWSVFSHESAVNAEAWAIGERDGVAVGESDATYHNNSKYYKGLAEEAYRQSIDSLQSIRAYINLLRTMIGTVYLTTEDGSYINTEDGSRLILDY